MQLSVEYGCTDVAGWHRHSGGTVRTEAVSPGLLSTTAQKHCTRVQAGMHLHTMHLPRDPWLFSASAGTKACFVWPASSCGLLSGRLLFGGSDSPTCFCVEVALMISLDLQVYGRRNVHFCKLLWHAGNQENMLAL